MNMRSLALVAFSLGSSVAAIGATKSPIERPTVPLPSTVFKWEDLPVSQSSKGAGRRVANQPTTTLKVFESHVTTLNPGLASHPPHRHAQEELILIKEGTLEVHINGTTQVAGPGSVLFYASNDAHGVKNVGKTQATYWVINLATPTTHDPAAHNKNPSLRSGVSEWTKLKVEPTKTGERRAVLKGSTVTLENLSVHVTTVKVNEASHAAHRHPDDEIVVVKEGELDVSINGKVQRATPGSICFFSSNDLHGMRNAGTTPATYYVIRMVTRATPKAAK